MPKLKPETQNARREHILDAAEQCFARTGFHRTTMQDICKQAGVSPGALYVYFGSKEALIAGITERDRAEFAEQFAAVAATPNFLEGLAGLGDYYFVEERATKWQMCVEIGVESTRNPTVAEIFRRFDREVFESFGRLFQRLKDEGRIAPALDIPAVTQAFGVIADGMFWRTATDPNFDPKAAMPAVLQLVTSLLNPVAAPKDPAKDAQEPLS
jgi:TetR/AcrR family transcriptional regulator, repressor for uid operon